MLVNVSVSSPVSTDNAAAAAAHSVSTTAIEILPANADRFGAVIVNAGTAAIYLGFGAAPTIATGIYLAPKGSYTIEAGLLFTGSVFAISTAAQSVRVAEFLQQIEPV